MRELILRPSADTLRSLNLAHRVWMDAVTSLERYGLFQPTSTDAVSNYLNEPRWGGLLSAADRLWQHSHSYATPEGTRCHGVLYAVEGERVLDEAAYQTVPRVILAGVQGELEVISDSLLDRGGRSSGVMVVARGQLFADIGPTVRILLVDESFWG